MPKIATGDLSVAFGITEADSGSGLDSKTTAVKQGNNSKAKPPATPGRMKKSYAVVFNNEFPVSEKLRVYI